jgi:acetylornithine deacetylase/succinyl-diaminopimelate desuccinylase-like protein
MAGQTPAVDLILTGNVGEEGNGNLRGMRAVMDRHPEIGAAVAIEGHNLGRVTHVAVGSRRLRIRVSGPGGHSWGDFGRANAIHVAAEIIHELSRLPSIRSPKTTLSVGTIEGGISINTIPPVCTFEVDTRSVSASSLSRLSERVDRVLRSPRNGARVAVDVIGERPAGMVPIESPIVRSAIEVLAALGVSATADASSTDANIPISRGVPSVCIGLTSGGNAHREDEFIDLEPLGDGLAQLGALSLVVANALADGAFVPVTGDGSTLLGS